MEKLNNAFQFLQSREFFGDSALRWLAVAVAVVVGFLVLRVIRAVLIHRASRAGDWFGVCERLLRQTKSWFLLLLLLCAGSLYLEVPRDMPQLVAILALVTQGALWASAALGFFVGRTAEKRKKTDPASATTLSALGFLGRLAIWAAAVLLVLANLGYNVTTLVAGLGIGGIAVALAAQNILGDLFASASIVLDKPFVLGDFIVVGSDKGCVEYIGLKTTRLRSLSGEQLVFSNADLLKSRIRNYKRMSERRVLFTVGVEYDTPAEKVAAIPAMLRAAVESQSSGRFDRAHFARFGDSALIFEIVYYVLTADYTAYMDIQQAINLELFRRFGKEKIAFAFPSQTVYLHQQA